MMVPARLAPVRIALASSFATLLLGVATALPTPPVASGDPLATPAPLALGARVFDATFDGRGLALDAREGDVRLGLELVAFGFETQRRDAAEARDAAVAPDVTEPSCARIEGRRLAFTRDEGLTEWYLPRPHGLEHGYTLAARPAGEGALTFTLRVSGDLSPRVRPDARGVEFVTSTGERVLAYDGLTVFDADGRVLRAGIEVVPDGFRILVDEHGARYPITVDPVFQQAYVKASNTDAGDVFGAAVAVSGDTLVVGAYAEASNATGVGGNEADDSLPYAGAAYVFVRNGGTWSQQAYLKASNTDASDTFGASVAISGDTIVVGASGEASNATGVNGNAADNSALNSGAAYVFVRSGTTWTQQAYLKASNTQSADSFGTDVAISGDTIAVGAPGEASNAVGVNGNQADNSAFGAGAVYVFVRSGTTWTQQAYLKASNTGAQDDFGGTVALSGDTLAVGATNEDSNALGVNGNSASNAAPDSGAVYVFVRSGTTWTQQAYVKASNTGAGDFFGRSIAVDGDRLAVGTVWEASNATGVNGDQANNSMLGAGAVYVFVRGGSTWAQQAYVKASNTQNDDYFCTVALSGDVLVVGAEGEDSGSAGVGGNPLDNSVGNSGAAYVFVYDGVTWSQVEYLKASNPGVSDAMFQVALSGTVLVVGAQGEASDATGIDGNQSSDAAPGAGAAYVFDLADLAAGSAFCPGDGSGTACPCGNASALGARLGCANSLGAGAGLRAVGSRRLSADTVVLVGSGMPNGPCLFLQGTIQLGSPAGSGVVFGDALRCVGGTIVRLAPKTNVGNTSRYPEVGDVPLATRGGVLVPGPRHYQIWYRDAATFCTSSTFSLTNGVTIDWLP